MSKPDPRLTAQPSPSLAILLSEPAGLVCLALLLALAAVALQIAGTL